ncbi:MAG: TIGR03085 family metal-binding protein [Acidimicrobiales bacterium]
MGVAHSERLALCALLEEAGPLAPTLCDGWATSDLAAHLFVRESRPWAAIGILVPPLSGVTQAAMDGVKRSLGYEGLVRRIVSGPPMPIKPFDEQMNTMEYFVHHEDVRRALDEDAGPRDDPALDGALWNMVRRGGRLLARKVRGPGLELVAPGHGSVMAHSGSPVVKMTASPQELVLYLFGRSSVAKVVLDGPEAARRVVEETKFGL